jgi:peroxiredoxin
MSRLDDIAARNRRANRPRRSWLSYVFDEIHDAFDGSIPAAERRPKQIALAVIVLLIAGAIATYLLWPRGSVGGKVQSRTGDTIELASLWKDRRTVVVFYPGTCDCGFALEDLEAHRTKFDANLIAISSHSATHAAQLVERWKLGFEIYVDPKFKVIPKWGVPFVIADATAWAVFIVEPDGTVSFKKIREPLPSWDEVAAMTRRH